MDPEPIHGEPALFAPDISTLFIADLHIGLEQEILQAGARIPPKTGEMQSRLLNILKSTKAKTLVIAGDLKHNIPVSSFHEEREIPRMIDALFDVVDEIHLVPGNHDGGIANYLPRDVILHSNKGFVLGDYGIWHGHCWPSEEVMASRTVLMGHVHPQAAFVDGVGSRSSERCWVRGKWNFSKASKRYGTLGEGFIMLPAFNDLCGGSRVNDIGQRKIGTVLRHDLADIGTAELFLLDGTNLGKVGDNPVSAERR
ncbi:MAG: metallophosphoesterase [Candidatus Thermoplasmatota archaeon]|nr:metallophosphoesterase [Euryarchaeota archaeon]MBU4032984.1 metallophosphoesterase [Candidatus Thermoplasmatota archaeon]MBU4071183.1 metallophosphoesterase [Candidatus Thermoplasmatota archaeon]MBU4143594.1 metallophosphoesterase [Candidatus Thermoplasmatota archaeon]MBU4591353.1 metallophosphoesterase [Candidatus Thermoplasmatota archaeon]